MEKEAFLKLEELTDKYNKCTLCPIHKLTNGKVHYRGAMKPIILFVGEAPGESEDACQIPFMGVSGRLLDKAIQTAGIDFKYRGYTNTILCTPYVDERRAEIGTPTEAEMKACRPRLLEYINHLSPQKIVAVGDKAKQSLTKLKQEFFHIVHPSFVCGENSVEFKKIVLQLRKLKEELNI